MVYKAHKQKNIIGWREWLTLPQLGIPAIKAKNDTGARTSALHTFSLEGFAEGDRRMVRFGIHPLRKLKDIELFCEAPVLERRRIKNSGGHIEKRYVISYRSMSLIIEHTPYAVGLLRMFLVTILISSALTGTINACPFELPTATVSINGHPLVVELAATHQARACGLSKRSALNENHGMLFVYPRSDLRTFWMKDTWIPLSIAFLDDSGHIINIEFMSPNQTEKRYHSSRPALYALEVNQGWFRLHGIKAGDRVEMKQIVSIGGPPEK